MFSLFLMDQVTWNSNLWYILVVTLITSWHWILRLLGTISVFYLFDSWNNSSFRSKKSDSRFIQIYSSASSKYKTWFISKGYFNIKHSTFHYKKKKKTQITSSFHLLCSSKASTFWSCSMSESWVLNIVLHAIDQHQALIMLILQNYTQWEKAKPLCFTHEPMHQNKEKKPIFKLVSDYHVLGNRLHLLQLTKRPFVVLVTGYTKPSNRLWR